MCVSFTVNGETCRKRSPILNEVKDRSYYSWLKSDGYM
jgi:hypothetical protein